MWATCKRKVIVVVIPTHEAMAAWPRLTQNQRHLLRHHGSDLFSFLSFSQSRCHLRSIPHWGISLLFHLSSTTSLYLLFGGLGLRLHILYRILFTHSFSFILFAVLFVIHLSYVFLYIAHALSYSNQPLLLRTCTETSLPDHNLAFIGHLIWLKAPIL